MFKILNSKFDHLSPNWLSITLPPAIINLLFHSTWASGWRFGYNGHFLNWILFIILFLTSHFEILNPKLSNHSCFKFIKSTTLLFFIYVLSSLLFQCQFYFVGFLFFAPNFISRILPAAVFACNCPIPPRSFCCRPGCHPVFCASASWFHSTAPKWVDPCS